MLGAMTVNRMDLIRRTRKVFDHVRRGCTVIVASHGKEEVAILNVLDYRLLRAAAAYHALPPHQSPAQDISLAPRGLDQEVLKGADAEGDPQAAWNQVMIAYLDGDISLGKAAQLLGISSLELRERLNRLGIPLRLGPSTIDEARAEYEALRG